MKWFEVHAVITKAHAYYLEWEDEEPWSTILLCYECTED